MSNLGLERHLKGIGLALARTPVGDRYVLEHMREGGFNLGGEPSGHIIMSDYATTGDGFVAALQVLAVVKKHGRPVSEVCHRFDPLPQVMKNVRYAAGKPLEDAKVKSAIEDAVQRLDGHGPACHPRLRHRAGDPRDGRGREPAVHRGSGRRHRGCADQGGGVALFRPRAPSSPKQLNLRRSAERPNPVDTLLS